jgi:hypothetical protein
VTVFSNPFLEMLAEEQAEEEKQQQKLKDEDSRAGQAEVRACVCALGLWSPNHGACGW